MATNNPNNPNDLKSSDLNSHQHAHLGNQQYYSHIALSNPHGPFFGSYPRYWQPTSFYQNSNSYIQPPSPYHCCCCYAYEVYKYQYDNYSFYSQQPYVPFTSEQNQEEITQEGNEEVAEGEEMEEEEEYEEEFELVLTEEALELFSRTEKKRKDQKENSKSKREEQEKEEKETKLEDQRNKNRTKKKNSSIPNIEIMNIPSNSKELYGKYNLRINELESTINATHKRLVEQKSPPLWPSVPLNP